MKKPRKGSKIAHKKSGKEFVVVGFPRVPKGEKLKVTIAEPAFEVAGAPVGEVSSKTVLLSTVMSSYEPVAVDELPAQEPPIRGAEEEILPAAVDDAARDDELQLADAERDELSIASDEIRAGTNVPLQLTPVQLAPGQEEDVPVRTADPVTNEDVREYAGPPPIAMLPLPDDVPAPPEADDHQLVVVGLAGFLFVLVVLVIIEIF